MGLTAIAANAGKQSNGTTTPFQLAGTPTSGASGTQVSRAIPGSQLVDTATGKLYIATVATGATVTWVLVGAQV